MYKSVYVSKYTISGELLKQLIIFCMVNIEIWTHNNTCILYYRLPYSTDDCVLCIQKSVFIKSAIFIIMKHF